MSRQLALDWNLDFKIDEDMNPISVITSSKLQISCRQTAWKFEESILDDVCVAVSNNIEDKEDVPKFSVLNIDQVFELFIPSRVDQD